MKAQIEVITPSVAQRYLEMNKSNRKIRERHVYFLRDEILEGRWQPNGATIVFGNDHLLDGQHRLLAVVAAKKPIRSPVVHGVPDEYYSTIDMGSPRRASDVLHIAGEKQTGALAATITWILRYKEGEVNGRSKKRSGSHVEKFLAANGRVRRSVALCGDVRVMSGPVLAACHFLFSKHDEALADKFVEGVREGVGKIDRSDPVYLFRERMIEDMARKVRLHSTHQFALAVTAWNSIRKGEGIANGGLALPSGDFPVII